MKDIQSLVLQGGRDVVASRVDDGAAALFEVDGVPMMDEVRHRKEVAVKVQDVVNTGDNGHLMLVASLETEGDTPDAGREDVSLVA